MTHVILIVHIILALAIIGLVLLQRGTGGGLGIGSSGGAGGFATPRSAANILTKATTWCAILFFGTSLSLAIIASRGNDSGVMKELTAETAPAYNPGDAKGAIIPDADKPAVPVDAKTAATPDETPAVEDKAPEAPATP